MTRCLGDKAKVVEIDRGRLRTARVTGNAHYFLDNLAANKADLLVIDREILRLVGDNRRNHPEMKFDDAMRKVVAEHRRLIDRKRITESLISCAAVEIGMGTGGAAA